MKRADPREIAKGEAHEAHVALASKTFRDVGFTLAAMQWKRTPEALQALRDFNGVPENWLHPFAWGYHPNEYRARFWEERGRLA